MSRKGIPSLDELFPRIPNKCGNCKKDLPKHARRWCSHECSQDAYIRTDSSAMRNAVSRRDGGVCLHCGWDTRKFTHVLTAMHAYAHSYGWNKYVVSLSDQVMYEKARKWLIEELKLTRHDWSSLWEGDHIIPLVEGGKHELSNMRTLCFRCHKKETKALAGRLAAARREKSNGVDKLFSESSNRVSESAGDSGPGGDWTE